MPENRHFWQGLNVSWNGEIIDVMAQPHGGSIFFTDIKCGVSVSLDRDAVPKLYSSSNMDRVHLAVAKFVVSGRLSYRNGEIVLRPTSLKQVSPWTTGDDARASLRRH
jgi:hypothetical protein